MSAADAPTRFAGLRGDRLAVALVGDFSLLQQVAQAGAVSLNTVLLNDLQAEGELEDLEEMEGMGEIDVVRERLEEVFNRFLDRTAPAAPRLLLDGLETLLHFGANVRRIREYAVNNKPVGLLLPGTVQAEQVRFYGDRPVDCEFDQIWEITQ